MIDNIYYHIIINIYSELLMETSLSLYLHQITVTEAGLDFTKVITVFNQVAMIDTRKAFVDLVLIDNDENNLIFNAIQSKNNFVFCNKSVFS